VRWQQLERFELEAELLDERMAGMLCREHLQAGPVVLELLGVRRAAHGDRHAQLADLRHLVRREDHERLVARP
jgi:hypothetical protein